MWRGKEVNRWKSTIPGQHLKRKKKKKLTNRKGGKNLSFSSFFCISANEKRPIAHLKLPPAKSTTNFNCMFTMFVYTTLFLTWPHFFWHKRRGKNVTQLQQLPWVLYKPRVQIASCTSLLAILSVFLPSLSLCL